MLVFGQALKLRGMIPSRPPPRPPSVPDWIQWRSSPKERAEVAKGYTPGLTGGLQRQGSEWGGEGGRRRCLRRGSVALGFRVKCWIFIVQIIVLSR